MTLSPGSSSVRTGIHRWTIDIIFRGPAAGQSSVVLSTGLRAGFKARIVLSLLVGIVGLRTSAGLAWIRFPRIAIAIAAVIHPRRRRLAT